MKLNIGFLEIMFAGGVYLYSQAFALSLTLIITACILKFMYYVMEYDREKQSRQKTERAVDDLTNSIKSLFDFNKVNNVSKYEKKTFH